MTHAATQDPERLAPKPIRISSGDKTLSGMLHLPKGRARAAVVLHGATGVPQSFYQPFAAWLAAERGLACLTYDYSDFGASAVGPMAQATATMADWGARDQPAAQAALEARLPGVPVWVIGHSLGGLMLPFHPHSDRIQRAIMVASGPVHWRDHRWRYLPLVMMFWFLVGPLATWVAGYAPGRRIGFGSDLPRGVYWQWRRWCLTRWFSGDPGPGGLPVPNWYGVQARIKFVAVSDDTALPPHVVWRLMRNYPAAAKRQLTLRPEDFGLPAIGHIGAFDRRNAVLWPEVLREEDPAPPARAAQGIG